MPRGTLHGLVERLSRALDGRELTAEQLRSRVTRGDAALIGPHGAVLPVAAGVTIGRDPAACELAALHASVSAVHARIERANAGWIVIDLDSTNGTTVDGAAAAPGARVPLGRGARLGIGEVVLWFWPAPLERPAARARRATRPGHDGGAAIAIGAGGATVELRGGAGGGVVRVADVELALAGRELALLRLLAARRREVDDPEWAFVGAAELAGALGFRSVDADGDNVRELVCRVRRKLAARGLGGLIEGRRRAGYRLGAVGTSREGAAARGGEAA